VFLGIDLNTENRIFGVMDGEKVLFTYEYVSNSRICDVVRAYCHCSLQIGAVLLFHIEATGLQKRVGFDAILHVKNVPRTVRQRKPKMISVLRSTAPHPHKLPEPLVGNVAEANPAPTIAGMSPNNCIKTPPMVTPASSVAPPATTNPTTVPTSATQAKT
jgi:hypothetical protein